MQTHKNQIEWYLDKFSFFESKLNGRLQSPIHQIRRNAIEQLAQMNFPSTKNEEWKFTNVSPILNYNFIPAVNADLYDISNLKIDPYLLKGFDSHLLVFFNGNFVRSLSRLEELPKGIILDSLSLLEKENPELLKKYINKISSIDNAFNALNTAFAYDGAVLIVPDNVVVEKPIQVLFLSESTQENLLNQPRNLFVVGKNSQVEIITNYQGISAKEYLSNIVTEILVGENSYVDLYKVQNESENSFHIEKVQALQKRSSVFNHYNFVFGGSLVRNDINSLLDDEGIECHFYGLYLTNKKRHVDNHTFVDHAKPNCMSNELYKGIMDDQSRGVFNGKILVRKGAQKTNAYQSNKAILLSDKAMIDTKPQLEIFADDVKCSHGAAIGSLDEISEFYIRSRGVPEDIAKSMLIRAFASDVVEQVKIPELKEQLNHLVFEHLHRKEITNQ
ncbi:Fe-S cluster assembly protein SufD [Melioribacteraceae bacterium 4301-Me]|uniref:Fe-S cluster assembly protein SufD n=1 Tax=Pyranulibacter aquaticus TaxID=3163344 RepID=UPI0035954B36